MEEIDLKLTKDELGLIVNSLASTIPTIDNEKLQFLLYHKLLFKLKGMK